MTDDIVSLLDQLYTDAKAGCWVKVLAALVGDPEIAALCSRYKRGSSGWTFLHQAAYFGEEDVARALIRVGASITNTSTERETPADVSRKRGHQDLAGLLEKAADSAKGLWEAPKDPTALPSSCAWTEGVSRRARREMKVAYGGGTVAITIGDRYFVDSLERTLVGWHGSYNPPLGMDDCSLLE